MIQKKRKYPLRTLKKVQSEEKVTVKWFEFFEISSRVHNYIYILQEGRYTCFDICFWFWFFPCLAQT